MYSSRYFCSSNQYFFIIQHLKETPFLKYPCWVPGPQGSFLSDFVPLLRARGFLLQVLEGDQAGEGQNREEGAGGKEAYLKLKSSRTVFRNLFSRNCWKKGIWRSLQNHSFCTTGIPHTSMPRGDWAGNLITALVGLSPLVPRPWNGRTQTRSSLCCVVPAPVPGTSLQGVGCSTALDRCA